MGGGEAPKMKIPDWKFYKTEGLWQVEHTQRMLALKGLKDPWARNEAWRYMPHNYQPWHRNALESLGLTMKGGFKWGALALLITIAADKAFGLGIATGGPHHHDDHH